MRPSSRTFAPCFSPVAIRDSIRDLLCSRDDRSHLDAFVEAVAYAQVCGGIGDGVAKSFLRFADGYRDRDCETTLAGAAEGAVADDLGCHLHVGVGENDYVILGAALALSALSVGAGAFVDVLRYWSRTDEADGAHFGMIEQGVDYGFSAVHEVDYALGQAGLSEQFVGSLDGERNALGRFEDEGVAAGDGVGQKPERDHAGKIEWRDRRDYAEWLADHHFVDAAGHVFEVVALHHHGNAAGDFDVLDGAAPLGFGLGEGLAVFLSDDAAQFVDVIFQKLLQFE